MNEAQRSPNRPQLCLLVSLMLWLVGQYSPHNTKGDRLYAICKELACLKVLCLTGTQRPIPKGEHWRVTEERNNFFHLWHFPAKADATHSNKASGITLGLSRRHFKKELVSRVIAPPAHMLGRMAILRVKCPEADIAIIAVYLPPNPQDPQSRRQVNDLISWIDQFIAHLPEGCLPMLMGDLNAHLGLQKEGHEWQNSSSVAVGMEQAVKENYNGTQVRKSLGKHYMTAVNTHSCCHATFYPSLSFAEPSRVDYICLPTSLLRNVMACEVWRSSGDTLQPFAKARRREHRPLVIRFTHARPKQPLVIQVRWDYVKLYGAAREGRGKREFLQAVESKVENAQLELERCRRETMVNQTWEVVNTAVRDTAVEF